MDNWLANIVSDVDSLHVEIDNLNDLLVGFCFIRSIDNTIKLIWSYDFFKILPGARDSAWCLLIKVATSKLMLL
jgi:hypothetical protein